MWGGGGKGGVVTPRPFAPPHDHAQPQASIPKRYTTVASLSSPVIGLGPCWVEVCGRDHSSNPPRPCTRARASAPPRAPIVAFIRTFWPHHSAPQSRRLVLFSRPRPAKSPRSAPLRRVRQAKPRFATQTGSKPNARPATHSLRVLPQRRESAQFNSYISEATTRWWWCGCYQEQPRRHRHAAPPPAIYAPSSGRWESTQTVAVTPIARRHSHTARITHSARRQGLPPLPVHPSEGWAWNLAGECLESNWNPIGT